MTNLLIISESFAPKNAVASIRFTKTAKYLARTGEYRIWVITEEPPLNEPRDELLQRDIDGVSDHVEVIYISNQRLGKKAADKKTLAPVTGAQPPDISTRTSGTASAQPAVFYTPGERLSVKKRLHARYLSHYQDTFAKKAYKAVKELMAREDFDAVITTYGGIGAPMVGLKIKKKNPDIRWIQDYRDVISAKTPALIKKQRRIAAKADALCDVITGASADCIGSGICPEKVVEITNACDPEDVASVKADDAWQGLTLCFSGSYYPGLDNAEPLFAMILELVTEGSIEKEKIRLILMGKNPGEIIRAARKYGLEDILDVRGFVPRESSISAQKASDILVIFTRNTAKTGSFMHAKLMEYLMTDKLILCIVSGDTAGSYNGRLIRENFLGACYEEATKDEDHEYIKGWLAAAYRQKTTRGLSGYKTPSEIKDRFSSEAMAMKFDRLIRKA